LVDWVTLVTRCSDPNYSLLAARSLRKQVKQLAEHLGGVRLGEDIEAIHHCRVASRRLRAALGMFCTCWKRKQSQAWKQQIRKLARNLGDARDHDVLIEFLASSLAGVSDRVLVPGIAGLLNHFERERLWLQPRVLKAIDRFEAGETLASMQANIHSILERVGEVEFVADEHTRAEAGKCVRKGLKKLLAEATGLAAPEQQERHHAMRVAAKRLRYTLELAKPIYSNDLASIGEAVKRLQAFLGEIHDCDVWVENFAEFARNEACGIQLYFGTSKRFERLRPGLDYLQQERRDRRRQVFDQLVAYWQELVDQRIWDRLAAIVEPCDAGASSLMESGDAGREKVLPKASS
jgi:CHAD domain-containing protein